MNETLYRILNHSAKRWWYHAQLRREGNVTEARRRERESIRSDVRHLRDARRNGGYLHHARFGWSLYCSDNERLESCYSGLDEPTPAACLRIGIPVIDVCTVADDRIVRLSYCGSLVGLTPENQDSPPWRGLSRAPLGYVACLARMYGATLYNFSEEMMEPYKAEARRRLHELMK